MKNNAFRGAPSPWRGTACARLSTIALLLAASGLASGCSSKTDDGAPAASITPTNVTLTPDQRKHVRLASVERSQYQRTIEATGSVDFNNEQATAVLAPFSGPVTRLLVDIGDHVNKGDPLALVDSPDFAAAITAYRKALTTAHTARRLADLEKDLVDHQGVAKREEDQAQADAANADADADAALKALVALNVDPKVIKAVEQGQSIAPVGGVIRSPIAGTVVDRQISPGQLLQAGTTPCFTVADMSRVWVMAQVADSDVASVNVGDPADVSTGVDPKHLTGTVTKISALVNSDTRLVPARVVVDNPQGALKKQAYVAVQIHSRQPTSGLLVPVSALLRDDENLPFVYVAQPDGSYARRSVTLGHRTGDQFDIPAGLKAGEQVVVDGGIFVQFMQNQ
ncbi:MULTISPECIES: efflux RND transporter periplasmic adaptor subunit [unclassified Dyella]|jgi:cobalt-zinc-cadmium efflux system membrane fusion protein|uniref:efflux RND transporter periplasmic adaptor subunit n=1 Tax=unclassified Dyella TaxID=2634549 RepID=UPI003F9173E3